MTPHDRYEDGEEVQLCSGTFHWNAALGNFETPEDYALRKAVEEHNAAARKDPHPVTIDGHHGPVHSNA